MPQADTFASAKYGPNQALEANKQDDAQGSGGARLRGLRKAMRALGQ